MKNFFESCSIIEFLVLLCIPLLFYFACDYFLRRNYKKAIHYFVLFLFSFGLSAYNVFRFGEVVPPNLKMENNKIENKDNVSRKDSALIDYLEFLPTLVSTI